MFETAACFLKLIPVEILVILVKTTKTVTTAFADESLTKTFFGVKFKSFMSVILSWEKPETVKKLRKVKKKQAVLTARGID